MAPLSLFLTIIAIIPLPIVLLPGFALAQNLAQFSFPNETPFDISLLKLTESVTVSSDVLIFYANSSSFGEVVYAKETIDPSSSFNSSFSVSIAPGKDPKFSFIIRRDLDLSDKDVGIFDKVQLLNISNIMFGLEFQWNMVDHANEDDKHRQPLGVSEFVNGLLTELDCHQPAAPQLAPPSSNLQVSLQYSAFEMQVSAKSTDFIPGTTPKAVFNNSTGSLYNLFTQPMYIGFIAKAGVFRVSQWDLTTAQTSNSNSHDSAIKLSTGYVVGFSLMGLVLVAVMVVGVCWCWRKRYMEKPRQVHGAATDDDHATLVTNPAIAIAITDLKSAPVKQQTVPASPVAGSDSAAFQVSGMASWLKAATPR